MVADDYRDLGAKILMPLARIIPLGPMGISFLSLLTALTIKLIYNIKRLFLMLLNIPNKYFNFRY